MVDVVTVGTGGGSIAWVSPEGTLKVGPRSAGREPRAGAATPDGGAEPTTTDAFLLLGHIPEHLLGGEIPLDRVRRRGRSTSGWPRRSAWTSRRARPACSRSPPGTRPTRSARSPSSAGSTCATSTSVAFGGSGPLTGVPADRHPRPAGGVRPARPRQLSARSACSPPTCATTTCRRSCAATTSSTLGELDARVRAARVRGARRARAPGPRRRRGCARSADLRYFGQAFEIQVPGAGRRDRRRVRRRGRGALPRRARARLRLRATATTRARSSSG